MSKRKTHNDFLLEFKNNNFNYKNIKLLSKYQNARTKIYCECKQCGYRWNTSPIVLLRGSGCKKCFDNNRKLSHEEFLSRIDKEINIITTYETNFKKVLCECKLDNFKWYARPSDLMNGIGCPECKKKVISNCHKISHQEFIRNFKKNNYKNISIIGQYKNNRTKIRCMCNKCKTEFYASPKGLLKNTGCPICFISNGENLISNFLSKYNIAFDVQKKFDGLIGTGNRKLSYDFYLPDYNLLIEFQGEQHERYVEYFGGKNAFIKQQEHDKRKREYAKEHNIELLEIWYWDFENIEKILQEKLLVNNKKSA